MIPALKLLVRDILELKGGYAMWSFIPQVGLANATIHFTNDLSLFLVGLVGLVWFSVGMIVVETVRYYLSEKTQPAAPVSTIAADYRAEEYREAA
jgi:hypothetical protein